MTNLKKESHKSLYEISSFLNLTNLENSQTTVRGDRKSTRLNSSHIPLSRMPSSA